MGETSKKRVGMHEYVEEYALGIPRDANEGGFWGRIVLLGILLLIGLGFIFHPLDGEFVNGHFIHGANLIIHEAGHVIFGFLGSLIRSMGGSLLQCLMPLVFCGTLLIQQKDGFGASVGFWWFAQNLFDLTPYIADARAGVIPLLGGNTGQTSPYGFHDWEFILTELGLIRHDVTLAWMVHWFGVLCMIFAYLWMGYVMYRYWVKLHPKPEKENHFYVG